MQSQNQNAQVAELVDAHVSGACAARCAGSSPALGTTKVLDSQLIAKDLFFILPQQDKTCRKVADDLAACMCWFKNLVSKAKA